MDGPGFWFKFWLFAATLIASAGCVLWVVVELLEKGGTLGLLLIVPLVATWATLAYWLTFRDMQP